MLVRGMAALAFVAILAAPAAAEVKSVAPNGFEVASVTTIAAPPERVYGALGEIGRWWSPAHTFSRDASNLSIELRAGGCFCERLKDGGSVQHMMVVYAAPGAGLRLRGALGPLQAEGSRRRLELGPQTGRRRNRIYPKLCCRRLYPERDQQWAPRIDRVLDEQLQRLKNYVEGKSPAR